MMQIKLWSWFMSCPSVPLVWNYFWMLVDSMASMPRMINHIFPIYYWNKYRITDAIGNEPLTCCAQHDDVIKWNHCRVSGPLCGNSPATFPHKGQWQRVLMFSVICAWTNGWVNNRDASDLRRHRAHYGVIVIIKFQLPRSVSVQGKETNFTHLPLDKMAAILADDLLKLIFFYGNDRIAIRISLKFVPGSPIDNKPALVQAMAWRRIGEKPLPELMLTQFTDANMRH